MRYLHSSCGLLYIPSSRNFFKRTLKIGLGVSFVELLIFFQRVGDRFPEIARFFSGGHDFSVPIHQCCIVVTTLHSHPPP
jgi:hypothetical protein